MPRVAFRNFTGGEVTPTLSARYDLQKLGSFLQCCENFIPNLHGDIERRPGMCFIADLGGKSVLIPFQFNTEPENNYVLIFQEGSITVASADMPACVWTPGTEGLWQWEEVKNEAVYTPKV